MSVSSSHIYSRIYRELLLHIMSIVSISHFTFLFPDLIVPEFLISDSWWEEFAIRLCDPVQSPLLCPSWHDCLLLQQSALFAEQQRQCRTRLSSTIISVSISSCQRKIQMDKRSALGKTERCCKGRDETDMKQKEFSISFTYLQNLINTMRNCLVWFMAKKLQVKNTF